MRILAHVHTFNDADVIEPCLEAIGRQSRPVDGIVIVDNGSSDGTLDREFPANVTVIRHGENLGTNGTVHSGMKFALEQGYDWIWIFDADSAPRPDALATLLDFYESLAPEQQARVFQLCSLPVNRKTGVARHGALVTRRGFRTVDPPPDDAPYPCMGSNWSGALFRLEVVQAIGLPPLDYVLDMGDPAYGYLGMVSGYDAYTVPASVCEHNIRGEESYNVIECRVGPLRFRLVHMPPIRYYYTFRNYIYFWLYEFRDRRPWATFRVMTDVNFIPKHLLKLAVLRRWPALFACLRGIRDGLFGHLERRY